MEGTGAPLFSPLSTADEAGLWARRFADWYRDRDEGDDFPHRAIGRLSATGLLLAPLAAAHGGIGLGLTGGMAGLLHVLAAIGEGSLSVGRLYEGHCNALQLIELYGTPTQQERVAHAVAAGQLFAVWNTDAPDSPVTLTPEGTGYRLHGAKIFCSGAGDVGWPLITAQTLSQGRRLCLVDAARQTLDVDFSLWRPLGMAASRSGRVGFGGTRIEAAALLGAPGDYAREPWFRGGAIRFAAVQLGGAAALLHLTARHLRATARADDPHQIARIGTLAIAVESGRAWLDRAGVEADRYLGQPAPLDPARRQRAIRHAHMTRLAIERICLDAIELATRSVGLTGLLRPHPLERVLRDLATYLRQPAPDAALDAVGRDILAGDDARA